MAAFLVTGNPGSGKSTLAQELARRGLATIDPDYDPELSYWEDDAGKRVSRAEGPDSPDEQWLRAHRWVWNRSRLQDVTTSPAGATTKPSRSGVSSAKTYLWPSRSRGAAWSRGCWKPGRRRPPSRRESPRVRAM